MSLSTVDDGRPQRRLTIGLPVYNGERFLDQTLESIMHQTFTDFELVISDNCSTDATPDIIGQWADKDDRIQFLPNDRNVGANRNYNRAFRHSTSPLFKWAADDDVLHPGYLAQCIAMLDADPGLALVHSRAGLIDRLGDPLLMMHHASVDGDGVVEAMPDPDVLYAHLADEDPVQRFRGVLRHLTYAFPIFGVIRRDALLHTRLLRNFYGADKILLGELALHGRTGLVEDTLWFRRCHPATSTRDSSAASQRSWSDPTAGASLYPIDMTRAYADAIRSADLSSTERRRAYAELTKKTLQPGKLRQIVIPGPGNLLGFGG